MYNHIEHIMVKSKVAEYLDEPVVMNKSGKIVEDEKEGYRYKVPIKITRPDLCLVLDKCGCDISQEGDGRPCLLCYKVSSWHSRPGHNIFFQTQPKSSILCEVSH